MKDIQTKYHFRGIFFHDDTFTTNRNWVIEFSRILKQENLDVLWGCNCRIDNLDEELIKIMYLSGCRVFHLGVESGSQRVP